MTMNYGLSTRYFSPNPHREPEAVFVRKEKFESVVNEARLLLESDRKPKIFVPADYGIGKTTLLRYIESRTADKAVVAYAECPPLNRRSSFDKVLGAILRSVTRETVFTLLRQAIEGKPASVVKSASSGKSPRTTAEGGGLSEFEPELADFLRNCIESGNELTAWRFLCGEKLTSAELKAVRGVRNLIEHEQVISFVNGISSLFELYEKKPLLILLDEFERTRPLLGESKILFKEGLRALVDESCKAGVVIAASVTALEELPGVMEDDAVSRRLSPYYISTYSVHELLHLAKSIIALRRTGSLPTGANMAKTEEQVDADTYPFTRQALESAIETIRRMRGEGRMRPADLLKVMDRALLIALEGSCPVIDSKITKDACESLQRVLWKA